MKKRTFILASEDLEKIEALLSKGNLSNTFVKRCDCLKLLHSGKTQKAIAEILGFSENTIGAWRKKYLSTGLDFLKDAPRPGRPLVIDGVQRAKITALACEDAPVGHSQWSLRLLADRIVELNICETISHKQVSNILKKTN